MIFDIFKKKIKLQILGTINAMTDIPLVPSISGQGKSGSVSGPSNSKAKHNFVLHWMNNKEMEFTVQAEKIMEDMLKMALERDDMTDEALEFELTHPDRSSNFDDTDNISLNKNRQKSHINVMAAENASQTGSTSSLALSEASNLQSVSTNVQSGGVPGTANISLNLSDTLDHRIETILKEWHQNSDLLFSIHPIG